MEVRRKDRERKRLSRLARKKHLDSHPHLKKAEQEKIKLQMRNYRLKIKSKEISSQLPESGKQLSAKKAGSKEERLAKETEKSETTSKEKKEGGQMSAELADESQASEVQRNDQDKSSFTSPASEKRAVKNLSSLYPRHLEDDQECCRSSWSPLHQSKL